MAPDPDSSGTLGGLSAGPWSGRYTGEIDLPVVDGVNPYTYGVAATGGCPGLRR